MGFYWDEVLNRSQFLQWQSVALIITHAQTLANTKTKTTTGKNDIYGHYVPSIICDTKRQWGYAQVRGELRDYKIQIWSFQEYKSGSTCVFLCVVLPSTGKLRNKCTYTVFSGKDSTSARKHFKDFCFQKQCISNFIWVLFAQKLMLFSWWYQTLYLIFHRNTNSCLWL